MTIKTAEQMVHSLDLLFQRYSLQNFVEEKKDLKHKIFTVEFPFTDSDQKRIPIVEEVEKEMSPLENACMLIASYSLQLEQRITCSDMTALSVEIERVLFDLKWTQNPRFICSQFFGTGKKEKGTEEDENNMDNLSLLFTQYLLFLKKALVFHERNIKEDKIDWQEKAWTAFSALCVEISQNIEGMTDLEGLSFMSIRPQLLSGLLQKKGDKGFVKGWKKRFFSQRGKLLQYFKSDTTDLNAVTGSIDLSTVGKVEERNDPNVGSVIAVHVPGRVFLLAPVEENNQEQLKFWLDGLRAWRGYLRHMKYDEGEAANAGLMSGSLWKKGVRGMRGKGLGWKQRYFTQIGDSLFYYDQTGITALGRIDLTDVSWIWFPKPNPKKKFKLHTLRDSRIWTLRCDSEAELEVWKEGILRYCQNGPPSDSKLARESMNWPDRGYSQVDGQNLANDSSEDGEMGSNPVSHSIITDDSTSLIIAPTPTSASLASGKPKKLRYVSLKCTKCSQINNSSRKVCSNCGFKLRNVTTVDESLQSNRRMTALPPLPISMPPKSDKVAHRAWKDLARRYREAGINPNEVVDGGAKRTVDEAVEESSGFSLSSSEDSDTDIIDESVVLFMDGSERRNTVTKNDEKLLTQESKFKIKIEHL
jgi:hypothetical protein